MARQITAQVQGRRTQGDMPSSNPCGWCCVFNMFENFLLLKHNLRIFVIAPRPWRIAELPGPTRTPTRTCSPPPSPPAMFVLAQSI